MATRLQFNESITGVTSNIELQRRLRVLHEELAELDQDTVQLDSIDPWAKQLGNLNLMMHKDKSVKAYLSCCLADVLRLYAPEAPYTKHQIKVSRSFELSPSNTYTRVKHASFSTKLEYHAPPVFHPVIQHAL